MVGPFRSVKLFNLSKNSYLVVWYNDAPMGNWHWFGNFGDHLLNRLVCKPS